MGIDTLGEWVRDATVRLQMAGFEDAALEAQVLAAHALGQTRSWVLAHPDAPVPPEGGALLERRARHEPLSYVTGRREFYGRVFRVGPGVLIPRQETESLVDPALQSQGGRVLDIGTGSGCLAITLALERPKWAVTACDISDDALRQAKANAAELNARVNLVQSDLVSALGGEEFDLIVSNPPYIRSNADLPLEIAQFEPAVALFAGEDGLDVYRRLAREAPTVMAEGAQLLVEIGDDMRDAVVEVFVAAGWWLVQERSDLLGRPRALAFALSQT